MADEKQAADSAPAPSGPGETTPDSITDQHQEYWRRNIRLVLILLSVWFLFGCVLSILLVDQLNQITFKGFKLGFWISQQGTILVFIALIFIYARSMQKLDREYGVEDEGGDEVLGDH